MNYLKIRLYYKCILKFFINLLKNQSTRLVFFFFQSYKYCDTICRLPVTRSPTLVSRLAENRVPLKAIMDRVGHADAKTTIQIYTHVTKKLKANVAEIMENY